MKRSLILTAAAIAVFLVSCKNSTSGLPIPKDAMMIVHINGSSLTSKLSWKEVQATDWFKDAYQKEEDTLQKALMDDPEKSGINIKSDFAFFMRKQGAGGYLVFEGKLKDAVAFENLVKKMHRNADIKKDGDLSYLKEEGTDLVSWTSSKFIFMSDMPVGISGVHSFDEYDQHRFHQDSLLLFTKALLDLSGSKSIEDDKRFTSLIKENGDLHFWMNMDQYMSVISQAANNPMLSMMQGMNGLFEGSVATGTLSFDDGKIAVKTKRYLSDKMKQVMDKYQYKNITEDEVNRIPSNDIDAAIIVNYPPEVSKDLLKTMGFDGFVNGFLGKYNTNLDEIVSATKGNLIFAVSDFGMNTTEKTMPGTDQTYKMPEPNVNVLLALSINNKPTFDKLLNLVQQHVQDSAVLSKINYKISNDWFAISNKPETVNAFLAGNTGNKVPFADKITGHPFGAYVDLQKLIKGFRTNAYVNNLVDTSATSMWQNIVATGGDYKDGVMTGEFTLNLLDKNTNSLKQLNQFVDKMYRSTKKKEQEYMKDYPATDSTVALPPVMNDTSAKTH